MNASNETIAAAAGASDPATIVIFGATGDLARRKLLPALYAMFAQNLLPSEFAILGAARSEHSDDSFRALTAEALSEFSRVPVDSERAQAFCSRVYYQRADAAAFEAYRAIRSRLFDRRVFPPNHLFYLSVKPELFAPTLAQLDAADLIQPDSGETWTRIVVEKPFGQDLESARALNRDVRQHVSESQLFRIDHYLGKETVQNILSFRFANAIFEPLFNNHLVDHIQITVAETVGMESGRGAYYDSSGALRDMLQNHMLQLLCLVAMEPPAGLTADAIRNEKVKVLQAIRPFAREELRGCCVRAQYGPGENPPTPAYTQEDRVAKDSRTETFVALRLFIDNWRWAGVPVFLRTGKRLARRATEIVVQFKKPPLQLFQLVECVGDICDLSRATPNLLIFRIQPDEGISLQFAAKRPVMQMLVENVMMDFTYAKAWQKQIPEAYERLLLDVLRGDSTLFTRADEVEAAWRVVDPILRAWSEDPEFPLATYAPGSWGPAEADALFLTPDQAWRNPAGAE